MIKVQSLIQDKHSLLPVEVELALWPGLPGIHFLGLPDQHLKESAVRIKSAIKASGFQFPVAQQILVNLRPSYLKKTSRGLELAVAAAYLWESGQVSPPLASSDFYIYGELGLSGDVIEPEDLVRSFRASPAVVMTGMALRQQVAPFRRQVISHLKKIEQAVECPAVLQGAEPKRPMDFQFQNLSRPQARLLEILAVGEHSALLAGPAGSGKSTIAQALPAFLRAPTQSEFSELIRIHQEFGSELQWRPVVKPHHSTPTMSMIGGGRVPVAGEISRAHGGVLILDELLEFSSTVQEALREPFEEGRMRVYRNGQLKEFPARAQIVATTNLCPCGKWTPLAGAVKLCSFSSARCKSFGPRLSGPLVDRFEILEFTDRLGELEVSGPELLRRIQKAQEFSRGQSKTGVPNSQRPLEEITEGMSRLDLEYGNSSLVSSHRRRVAVFRVARTLADLEQSPKIQKAHLDEAVLRCQVPFQKLARWF